MELVNEIWLVNKTKLGNFHLFFAKIGVCQKPFKLGHFSLIFGHFILISGRHLIGDCQISPNIQILEYHLEMVAVYLFVPPEI